MKRWALMIVLLSGSLLASAQPGFIVHLDSLQAGRSGNGVSVREVDGGYLVFCGQFAQDMPSRSRVFVRKLGPQGQFLYEHEHRPGEDRSFDIGYIDAVADLPDGTFAAALAEGFGNSGETWLYRFDTSGDTLLRKFLFSFPADAGVTHAIRQTRCTADDGFVLAGFADYGQPSATAKAFLCRLNAEGDTVWTRRFGAEGQANVALGVEEYPDGGFVLTGYRNYGSPHNRSFLIRTNPQGFQTWRRDYGGTGGSNGAVRVGADGSIYTWSSYRESNWTNNWWEMILTKWDGAGNVVWRRHLHHNYLSFNTDFEILSNGSFVVAGGYWNRAIISLLNDSGFIQWTREYNVMSGADMFMDVQPTVDGGFVMTGSAVSNPPFDPGIVTPQVILLVKTDSLGCVVPGCQLVGVEEYLLDLNEHLRVWPNPVARGQALQLSFTPPDGFTPNGPLRVVVQDAMGRQVYEELLRHKGHSELRGTKQEGVLTAVSASLAPGLYHVHLVDNTRWLAGAKVVVE